MNDGYFGGQETSERVSDIQCGYHNPFLGSSP